MPMRVIGGEARGRTLKGPPREGVRPTSDRVREALFEILGAHGASLTRVLDLYSGTGALGIEALSRGAEHCDFVEADSKTCGVIRENLSRTRTLDRARVYPLPVARALSRLSGPYALVVADPPYEYDRAERELVELVESGLLAEDAIIAVEHSKRREWPEQLKQKPRLLSRRYGDTFLTLYQ
jgi:16S rRNA (guanine966-N2)-methyltransferase